VPRGVSGGAAAVAVAGGLLLGIRLGFHHHAPEQLATFLAFHKQAADELGGDHFGRVGEEGWGEVLGGRGGYGSGLAIRAYCGTRHRHQIEAIARLIDYPRKPIS